MSTWFHTNAEAKTHHLSEFLKNNLKQKCSTCKTKLRSHFKLFYNTISLKCYHNANEHFFKAILVIPHLSQQQAFLVQKGWDSTKVYHLFAPSRPIQLHNGKHKKEYIHGIKGSISTTKMLINMWDTKGKRHPLNQCREGKEV